MQVSILGPVEVRRDGVPVPVGGARVRALLVRLAAAGGRGVSSGELVAAIWPEDSPADEVNALQSLVSRLRRALGDPGAVAQVPGGYRLAVDADSVDAHRFEQLARAGRAALREGDYAGAASRLGDALALWRAPAIEDAADPTGPHLTELRLGAYEDRLEADIRRGRAADVIAELDALAVAHPNRERATALLMDALCADGRTAEALAAYERARRHLADTLGIDPSPALAARHLSALRGESPALAETAAPAQPRRTNLRAPLTSFLGRDQEMERVASLLETSRLVTLVGPGGAGKTRLACEVGARLVPGTRDGVWLVELAAVTDPVDLAQSVIGSLGVREAALFDARKTSRREATDQLLDAFAGKSTVLIVDNCEHLLDAAAQLVDDLLAHCPDLRVLATSREALGITGEVLFGVPPLRSRAAGGAAGTAAAREIPSVALFLDRAGAVGSGVQLTDGTLEPILEICRRLDGLPLAIELAAARTRSMTVDQIADRLGDRFRLLTGGSRTALPRHRTLRAVVEWSWDLLTPRERDLAERVSVLSGGVTAASAASVAGVDEAAVLDLLAALVDKSLLQHIQEPSPRYRMLETIREFGMDQLLGRGELRAARDAHARYFRSLARTAEPLVRTSAQLPWITLLHAERDNILAALQHLAEVGDADGAVDLAADMGWFWTMRGDHAIAETWLGFAVRVPGGTPSMQRALIEAMTSMNSGIWSGEEASEDRLRAQLATLEPYLDAEKNPMAVVLYFVCLMFTSAAPPGGEDRLEALLAQATGWTRATLQMIRALGAENRGDVALMRRILPEALEEFRAQGERFGLASCLEAQARVQLLDGDVVGAMASLTEGRQASIQLGAHDDAAQALCWRASCRIRLGDWDAADADLAEAAREFERLGAAHGAVMTGVGRAEVARCRGDLAAARRAIGLVEQHLRAETLWGPLQFRAMALTSSGLVAGAEGRLDVAAETLREAVTAAERSEDMPVLSVAVVAVSDLALRRGDPALSARLLGAADAARGTTDATHQDVARISAAVLDRLGPRAYAAAHDAGMRADRGELVAAVVGPQAG